MGRRGAPGFSDSQLLVKQINNLYRVKSPRLCPLYQEAQRKIQKLNKFEIFHIPREENQKAGSVGFGNINSET